jgi:hypothetical protein
MLVHINVPGVSSGLGNSPVCGDWTMKTLVLGFCILGAAAAFGQTASVLSNEPAAIQINNHPARASQKSLASERSLLISSNVVSARGERPLWELVPSREEVSLGEAARLLRKQHAAEKKAKVYVHD